MSLFAFRRVFFFFFKKKKQADGWYKWKAVANGFCRVKLPKSFVAVNLSDAFTFEEHENTENDSDAAVPGAETITHLTSAPEGQDVQSSEEKQMENPQSTGEAA